MPVTINGSNGLTFNDGSVQNTVAYSPWRNRIINGSMAIDQRNNGASVALNATVQFVVDRFPAYKGTAAVTFTAQRSTTAPAGFANSIIFTASTGATPAAGDINGTWHVIEGFNVADLGWGTANAQSITLSFSVRASVTGTYCLSLNNSAQNRFYVATYTVNAANTWEYKTVTIPGDTSGTWLTDNSAGLQVTWDLGYGTNFNGTAGSWGSSAIRRTSGSVQLIATTGATFYITGVQLEAGSTATPFERVEYGEMLRRCQRYFVRYTAASAVQALGFAASAPGNAYYASIFAPTPMRATPSASTSGSFSIRTSGADYAITSLSPVDSSANTVFLYGGATSLGNGLSGTLISASSGATVNLSAEL